MKTKDLLAITRLALNDIKKPYLWSDEEIVGWLAEGEGKAARNAHLLRDFTTPEICRHAVLTSRQYLELDPRVISVRRLTLATRASPLHPISFRDLDTEQPGWIDRVGTPDRWCRDFESGRIWFNRKPSAADTARILVVRMPLNDLCIERPDAEPEIPSKYHRSLHHWPCYRAHSKPDSDGQDEKKAGIHYQAFVAEFGEDSTAIEEQWAAENYGDSMDGQF